MDKVYCKNCKYRGFLFPNYCFVNPNYIEYSGSKKLRSLSTAEVVPTDFRNHTGECSFYEHKWWKFWVN